LRKLAGAAETDAIAHKRELVIERAEREVGGGNVGGEREPDRLERGGGRFRVGARARREVTDAPEKIELPRRNQRRAESARERLRKRVVGRGGMALARERTVGSELRPVITARDASGGAGLLDARGGGAKILIRGD
jgi:hypothetical protein